MCIIKTNLANRADEEKKTWKLRSLAEAEKASIWHGVSREEVEDKNRQTDRAEADEKRHRKKEGAEVYVGDW